MAMVFLAGPLSGLFMQPLIGVLADNSTSRFGRRRPYMLLGTILCVFGMLLLGYTRSIAAVFTGWDNSKVCCLHVRRCSNELDSYRTIH
jgi:solute carrier family 45 protein 1/2/4